MQEAVSRIALAPIFHHPGPGLPEVACRAVGKSTGTSRKCSDSSVECGGQTDGSTGLISCSSKAGDGHWVSTTCCTDEDGKC